MILTRSRKRRLQQIVDVSPSSTVPERHSGTDDNFSPSKNKTMAAVDEESLKWPATHERIFIRLMEAELDKGRMLSSTFSSKQFQAFSNALKIEVRRAYSEKQLKQKFNRLKSKFRVFTKLIKTTGFGWDSITNTVTAEDEVWETYLQANKDANVFQRRGLENYDVLCKIFQHSTATGNLARASTQGPLSSEEGGQLGGDNNSGPRVFLVDDDDIISNRRKAPASGSKARRPNKSPKTSIDDAMEAWTMASRARETRYIKQIEDDPYSMEECMKVLVNLPTITTTHYNHAMVKFHESRD